MTQPKTPRVLLAEDNPSLRSLIVDVLTLEGYRVTEVSDSAEMQRAIAASESAGAAEGPYELVVTDIRMPGKSGLEALAELRKRGSQSRFVVITAFPEDATERRIHELDAKLLAKPFSLGEFRELMKSLLIPAKLQRGSHA
jgi:DNA-binding response OmpR family regulator